MSKSSKLTHDPDEVMWEEHEAQIRKSATEQKILSDKIRKDEMIFQVMLAMLQNPSYDPISSSSRLGMAKHLVNAFLEETNNVEIK